MVTKIRVFWWLMTLGHKNKDGFLKDTSFVLNSQTLFVFLEM